MKGKVHVYDVDNIDTDRIIPGKYTKTLDMSVLAEHCLEDLDESFNSKVTKGDILVAGENFGCGSSREQAPVAIKVAGIYAVIAKSFARIFYRNAINVGLPIFGDCRPFYITRYRTRYRSPVRHCKGLSFRKSISVSKNAESDD